MSQQKLKVLVVDDDPAALCCYDRLLRRSGHVVETAPGGEAALARMAAEAPFDVVILDFKMPAMDGTEFLRRMRCQGHAPEVILVSAFLTDQVRASAARMGVRQILEKPVDVEKLRAAIREAVPAVRAASSGQ